MKRDSRAFVLVEICLAILAGFFLFLMFRPVGRNRRVSVIISSSDSTAWNSLIAGMKQAAQEEDIDLVIVGTERVMTPQDERAMIQRELSDGADALIVQPAPGTETAAMLRETAGNVPLMLAPEDVRSRDLTWENASDANGPGEEGDAGGSGFAVTGPDFYEMGEGLAAMILEDYAGNLSGKTVGIAGCALNASSAMLTEAGFRDGLAESGARILWSIHGLERLENPDREIAGQPPVDLVVGLGDDCLEAAGEASEARRIHGAVVYGIGSSEKAIYYLDHDNVRGLVMPNGLHMGYQCVSEIARRLDSRFYRMKSSTISMRTVRRSDLFAGDNEDLFFLP